MVGIAIVGQGYMGRTHAVAWSDLGLGASIKYVVGRRVRASAMPAPHATFTTNFEDVLHDHSVDIVSVCTPTGSHADLAVRALHMGKHVVIEKPIALTLKDADRVRKAAAESGALVMVAHVVRFFAGYQAVRAMWAEGVLGTVSEVRASRSMATPAWSRWLTDEKQSGGMLVDFAIHDFDQANLFLGTPERILSVRRERDGAIETTIQYQSGGEARVLSQTSLEIGSPFRSSIALQGASADADYQFEASEPTSGEERPPLSVVTVRRPGGSWTEQLADSDPYAAELEYFASCVASGTPPSEGSLDSSAMALSVALAARRSLREGWVRLP